VSVIYFLEVLQDKSSEVTSFFTRPQTHCVAGIDHSLNFKGKTAVRTSVGREVCSCFWRREQLQSDLRRNMFRACSFQKYDSRPRGQFSLALWGNPQSNRCDSSTRHLSWVFGFVPMQVFGSGSTRNSTQFSATSIHPSRSQPLPLRSNLKLSCHSSLLKRPLS